MHTYAMNDNLQEELKRNIPLALEEDQVFSDHTSIACIGEGSGEGTLLLKEPGVVAGLFLIESIAAAVDSNIQVKLLQDEGVFQEGGELAKVWGPFQSLLSMERTAINFVQHVTSIASETARYVEAAGGLCDILDTRKTLPGHRYLQKYAVRMGGGKNHRFHLADQILIKDNHLKHLGVAEAIKKAREKYPTSRVQIEVENEKMFVNAVNACPDAILLDNMTPEMIKMLMKDKPSGIYIEASGGIELKNIRSYAETGVNGISVGKLTHSVRAIDMSLKIVRIQENINGDT